MEQIYLNKFLRQAREKPWEKREKPREKQRRFFVSRTILYQNRVLPVAVFCALMMFTRGSSFFIGKMFFNPFSVQLDAGVTLLLDPKLPPMVKAQPPMVLVNSTQLLRRHNCCDGLFSSVLVRGPLLLYRRTGKSCTTIVWISHVAVLLSSVRAPCKAPRIKHV